jgi:hypothetical protein
LVGFEVFFWLLIEFGELLGQIGTDVTVHLLDTFRHLQRILFEEERRLESVDEIKMKMKRKLTSEGTGSLRSLISC